MIGMDAADRPWVVAEYRVRPDLPDDQAHLRLGGEAGVELAVDVPEEDDLGDTECVRRRLLLGLAHVDERLRVGVLVPGALRAIGADAHHDMRARVGPFRERGAAAELDVVGMGADGEHARGHLPVERGHGVGDSSRARSSGTSTSNASDGSVTTRTVSPAARAASMCRANESGP